VKVDAGRTKKLRKTENDVEISGVEYSKRLREFHETQAKGSLAWASLPERASEENAMLEGDDEDDNISNGLTALLRRSGGVMAGLSARKKLPPDVINMKRMKDANYNSPSQAVIQSTKFHPTLPLLFTAGYDKTLRIFQVDGEANPKLQGVHLPDLPIRRAAWLPHSNEIIMVGRRKHYYVYDIAGARMNKIPGIAGREEKSLEDMWVSPDGQYIGILGNNGYIILLSAKTRQWIASLKLNGTARSLTFSHDGSQVAAAGGDGLVTVWDIGTRRVAHSWNDEGSFTTTALACSPDGAMWATGADSGVVNVYRTRDVEQSANPKPIRAIMNLTTGIDNLVFNADSQVLAAGSRFKKEALKLVHLPTCTVFANWPTMKTPLRTVASVDFSANSGFMSIGNDRGKVLLYRLSHYESL